MNISLTKFLSNFTLLFAKIWSILGIYLVIKYNHKKRKYLCKMLILSVVCCLLTSNQYKLNIFSIWNSIVDSLCCFPYMYIQLDHAHKLEFSIVSFTKWTIKEKALFRIYYSSVLIEPLVCDSRYNSEEVCQQRFMSILISISDKWVKYWKTFDIQPKWLARSLYVHFLADRSLYV